MHFTELQITRISTALSNSSNTSLITSTPFTGLTIQKMGSTTESSNADFQNNESTIQMNGFTSHNLFGERIPNPLCFDIDDDSCDQSGIDILDTSDIKSAPVDSLETIAQPDTHPSAVQNKLIKISFKEKPMITLRTENPIFIQLDSDSDISSPCIKMEATEYASDDNDTSEIDLEDNISMEIVPFCHTLDSNSSIPEIKKIKIEPEPTNKCSDGIIPTDVNAEVTTNGNAEVTTLPKRKSRRPSRFGDNGFDELDRSEAR